MASLIKKRELVNLIANRMKTDSKTAEMWLDAVLDTMYDVFRKGQGITLTGFGGFYLERKRDGCAFKFNPGQRLRALFGWSSTYKGNL
jgi:nucleoid DNA-binding protein